MCSHWHVLYLALLTGTSTILSSRTSRQSLHVVSWHRLVRVSPQHECWLPEASIPLKQGGNAWQFYNLALDMTISLPLSYWLTITKLAPESRGHWPHLFMTGDWDHMVGRAHTVGDTVVIVFEKYNLPWALLLRKQHFPRNHPANSHVSLNISVPHACLVAREGEKWNIWLSSLLVGGDVGEGEMIMVRKAISKICHTPHPMVRLNHSLHWAVSPPYMHL